VSPLDSSRIRAKVVYVAMSNIGFGETEGNNRGRFIRALGGIDGQEWCAVFAGYCYRRAFDKLKMRQPEWLYRRPWVPEPGAKRLTKNLGRVGRIWAPDHDFPEARPGDLVCFTRGILGWQGHVGIVLHYHRNGTVDYIAGNEGRNGKVAVHNSGDSKLKLWRFASLDV
jgi:hypothetical protein